MAAVPVAPAVDPDVEVERTWLDDGSWVDVARGWLRGADELYGALVEATPWQQAKTFRYERWALEPRLTSSVRPGQGVALPHESLLAVHRAVRRQYAKRFDDGFALAWYRDGADSVAFHRDRDMRWLDDTVIVLLTLGQQRPFLIRPRENRFAHEMPAKGATVDLVPGSGDLLVMGGATQVGWEHSVPKVARRIGGRISLQWRWTSGRGQPVVGASYRAPRHFTR